MALNIVELYEVYFWINVTLNAISAVAAVVIIGTIIKCKEVRRETHNIILLNWAVINIIHLVLAPLLDYIRWEGNKKNQEHIASLKSPKVHCLIKHFDHAALLFTMLSMLLMAFYSYFKLYIAKNACSKTTKLPLYCVIAICYVIGITCGAFSYNSCVNNNESSELQQILVISIAAVCTVIMLLLNSLHICKRGQLQIEERLKTNVPLLLSNVFLITFMLSFVLVHLTIFLIDGKANEKVLLIFCVLSLIGTSTTLFFLVVLWLSDTNFKYALKCKRRSIEEDDEHLNQDGFDLYSKGEFVNIDRRRYRINNVY